jgi:hypothetical protein
MVKIWQWHLDLNLKCCQFIYAGEEIAGGLNQCRIPTEARLSIFQLLWSIFSILYVVKKLSTWEILSHPTNK